jgi:glutamate racemase
MSTSPIGVFDSGVGGLSVLRSIRMLLPYENLLYVADSAHAPYGPKGEPFIRERSFLLADFLLEAGAKALVVACNTATAAAISELRTRYSLPVIGVEPALKPAAEQSTSGVVGVLATTGTIASDKFLNLQSRFSERVQILTRAGTQLVELIEQEPLDIATLDDLLRQYIAPMQARGADTLVLGCTHYSLIKDRIAAVAGTTMQVVDAPAAVAKELQRRLQDAQLLTSYSTAGNVRFFTSGDANQLLSLFERYWPEPLGLASLQSANTR